MICIFALAEIKTDLSLILVKHFIIIFIGQDNLFRFQDFASRPLLTDHAHKVKLGWRFIAWEVFNSLFVIEVKNVELGLNCLLYGLRLSYLFGRKILGFLLTIGLAFGILEFHFCLSFQTFDSYRLSRNLFRTRNSNFNFISLRYFLDNLLLVLDFRQNHFNFLDNFGIMFSQLEIFLQRNFRSQQI